MTNTQQNAGGGGGGDGDGGGGNGNGNGNLTGGGPACLICYSDDVHYHRAIVPCGHDDLCALCHLRLRSLHGDRKCPICKAENDRIVVDADVTDEVGGGDVGDGAAVSPASAGPPGFGRTSADDDVEDVKGALASSSRSAPIRSPARPGVTYLHKPFVEYNIWGDELGGDFVFREDVGMFFPDGYHEDTVRPLFGLGCLEPGCDFTNEEDTFVDLNLADQQQGGQQQGQQGEGEAAPQSQGGRQQNQNRQNKRKDIKRLGGLQGLREHLRTTHGLQLCNLCVDARRDFVSQLPRFNQTRLKAHMTKGDGNESGFVGHPVCEFCRPKRFYDLTKLHEHLNKDHYKCHVCDKAGRHNQFFKNYDKLSLHFDREHFLCHDAQCLAARFVVFENEIDLRGHEASVHGGGQGGGSTKIQLEFRVRRSGYDGSGYGQPEAVPTEDDFQYGLNGEVFVPQELPQPPQQLNEPLLSDPTHAARTAQIRAEAMRKRQEQESLDREEAFPSLGDGGAGQQHQSSQAPLVGWSSKTGGAIGRAGGRPGGKKGLAAEEFPSLGGASSSANSFPALPSAKRGGKPTRAVAGSNKGMWAAASGGKGSLSNAASAASAPSWPASSTAGAAPAAVVGGSMPYASSGTRVKNNAADLAPDNFPSLGVAGGGGGRKGGGGGGGGGGKKGGKAGTGPVRYAAAENFAKKIAKPSGAAQSNVLLQPQAFPSISASSNGAESSKKQIDAIKMTLGPANYKRLKNHTKEFARGAISPESYVDRSGALFEQGVTDADFVDFMPSLISSCPDDDASTRALAYLQSIQFGMKIDDDTTGGGNASSRWSAAAAPTFAQQQKFGSNIAAMTASMAHASTAPPPGYRAVDVTTAKPSTWGSSGITRPSGSGKSAWNGSSGAATVAKSSVAKAAEEQQQMGTATSFMAKEKAKERKLKQAEAQGENSGKGMGKKNKKKNDDLKALSFCGN